MSKSSRNWLIAPITFVCYTGAVHFGALSGQTFPAFFLLVLLVLSGLIGGLKRGEPSAWWMLFALLGLAAALELGDMGYALFYLPPILINAILGIYFGRSLVSGRVPVITHFAIIMDGWSGGNVTSYTQKLTLAWAVFFGVMALESLLLALFAPLDVWSLFTNLLNYLFVAIFFIVEYFIRLRALPELDHYGFVGFIRSLAATDFSVLGKSNVQAAHPAKSSMISPTLECWVMSRADEKVDRATFLGHVRQIADGLPTAGHAINLCEDRYLFAVAFCALLTRGQVNLLPPNRSVEVAEDIAAEFPDCYCITDALIDLLHLKQHVIQIPNGCSVQACSEPEIAANQKVAILYTSGSSGRPRPNRKSWREFKVGAQLTAKRFGFEPGRGLTVIATVPQQHMYGLELTVILPLVAGISVHGGRPFFPDDVRDTLCSISSPRVLVTTPVHLRACIEADLSWPEVDFIVSATAPLSQELAARGEAVFDAPVLDIFGSTETGAIASRRTARESLWRLYEGLTLTDDGNGCFVQGGHLAQPVVLNDYIRFCGVDQFELLGRCSDMVNIAGKRASLAELNIRLNEVAGVRDGVMLVQDEMDVRVPRLCAVVVAPHVAKEQILLALAQRVDPVFLPRPIYFIEHLPRNESGKLPRDRLDKLLEEVAGRS